MFDNRLYVIITATEVDLINFNEVMETSSDTLRYSVDGSRTFFKYEGDTPTFVNNLTTADGPYTHTEMLAILTGQEWRPPLVGPGT